VTDKQAEIEGVVNELDEIVRLNEHYAGDGDDGEGETVEQTAIRQARDLLKQQLEE
jgi:hypothetical protein